MVRLTTTSLDLACLALLLAAPAASLPLSKRIAQTTIDSVTPWESACDAAGGGLQCNPIAVNASATLLAAAGPCDQQDNADIMVDLAHTLNNDTDMITLAQIFAQQPRNSPTSQAVPYCQSAPRNAELTGLFQCQFAGASETTFVGGLAVGSAGTIPFGMSAPLSPAGSCPASPSGPVPDGEQLVNITQNPGVSGSSGSGSTNTSGSASAASSASASASAASSASAATTAAPATSTDDGDCTAAPPVTVTSMVTVSASATDASASAVTSAPGVVAAAPAPASLSSAPAAAATTAAVSSSASSVQTQNGQAAQALNAGFASLTASSPCTAGQEACIGGGFAQCADGAWAVTQCAAGETCVALPLVNSAGTSITCDTQADALARFADAGVSGGVDGSS